MTNEHRPDVTAMLAEFACAPHALPPEAIAEAREHILIVWLAAAAGASDRVVHAAASVSGPEATVTPPWSAFCNTVAAQQFTDVPSAAEICGAYAVAADEPDDVVVEAVAVGLEVAARLRAAFASPTSAWDVDAVVSRFATVGTVGRLLKLSPEAMVMAFGIAGGQAGGLAVAGGPERAIARARAAFDGVEACLIARAGYNASERIVEGPGGMAATLFPTAPTDEITEELGHRWTFATGPAESLQQLYTAVVDGKPTHMRKATT